MNKISSIQKAILKVFVDTPLSASDIAKQIDFPREKIYYHIKKLVALDILYVSETKEIKGIIQKKFLPKSKKIVFGELPKTSTGKIKKFELRKKAKETS